MVYFLFLVGFILLVKGADWLVDGAKAIASRMGVSELVIGLTIVSIGTSLPELIVNILASINDTPELAIGNVLGSNIANVLLILGLTAIVRPLPVQRNTVLSEIPFALAATLLFGYLANANLWGDATAALSISRWDGIILLFFFLLFMIYVLMMAQAEPVAKIAPDQEPSAKPKQNSYLLLAIGMVALFLGGKWVVDGAIQIATLFGMSEAFIGLTIVAIGTSLPELVTSIRAAIKGNTDIAVGNVVGSNIFNLLWILGISALITPLPFTITSNIDIVIATGACLAIIVAMIIGRRMEIRRLEGILFTLGYLAYLTYLVQRG